MERIVARVLILSWFLLPFFCFAGGGPCNLTLSNVVTPVTCAGMSNGAINLTPSGQNGLVTYLWSNGATSEDISGIPTGTYNVTATDAIGCLAVDSFVVGATATVTVDLGPDTAFCYFSGRTLVPMVQGATQFLWQNGSTAGTLPITGPGTYSVLVQNQTGCNDQDTVTIGQQSLPIATISTTHPGCGATSGIVDLTVTGGMPPYSFVWSTGAVTEDLVSLTSGTYAVTVSDTNGCKGQTNAIVIPESHVASYQVDSLQICTSDSISFLPLQFGLDFDGIDDYLEIADIPGIRPSAAFSLGCWIYPTSTAGPRQSVLEKRTPAQNGYSIQYEPTTGLVHVRLQNGPLLSVFRSQDSLQPNTWTHLAVVIKASETSLYLNGVLDTAVTYAGGVETTIGTPVRVGGGPNRWGFRGLIDEVVHWNIALNAEEVAELHRKNLPPLLSAVEMYLNFDEVPGTTSATDWSANANHALLVNMNPLQDWVPTNPMQLEFSWNFGDGGTDTIQNALHAFAPGAWQTFLTSLTVTSIQGCESADSINLLVHTPTAPLINADSAAAYCIGDTINLWLVGNYDTYLWSSGETNDTIVAVSSGLYAVTAQDSIGCIHYDGLPINFNPNSTPSPVVTPSGNVVVCLGDTLLLDVGTGYASYLWNTGDTTPVIAVTDSGEFVVMVANAFGCTNESDTVFVIAFAPPFAAITAQNNTLDAGAGQSFQWFLNGNAIPGAISGQFTASVNGVYTVLVTGQGGCVTLSDPYSFIVGITDELEWGFAALFPNPTHAQSTLQIVLKRPQFVNVEIVDLAGRMLFGQELKCPTGESLFALPTAELSDGWYLVKVTAGDGHWISRLVKF